MSGSQNPFPLDADRAEIWDMLVARDIRAWVAGDWDAIADDFLADSFISIDAHGLSNPDGWTTGFGELAAYRDLWVAGSIEQRASIPDLERQSFEITTLRDIEIDGDIAVAHKKFDGVVTRHDGSTILSSWQTLYQCRRTAGGWKIQGFVGFLPNPMGTPAARPAGVAAKAVPPSAANHATAGPYSPALEVRADHLVVISGQAAHDREGRLVGDDIRSQARATLENCRDALLTADVSLADVFKVTVYLSDVGDWAAFNEVYAEIMEGVLPVRTAVGATLLPGLLVEVDMWAVRS
jgi:enamine deaminase RidA (YjgF/YER057c/UK114 family)